MEDFSLNEGFIWFDGELVDWKETKIHVLTHGLHYASSVFEGERCYEGVHASAALAADQRGASFECAES